MEKIKKQPSKVTYFILLSFIMFSLISGASYAKYIFEQKSPVEVDAKNFYFTSNLLVESSKEMKNYTLQAGVDEIEFTLMNYPDELRTSEVDIQGVAILTKDSEEIAKQTFTLGKNQQSEQVIRFDNPKLSEGVYVVTATAESPYSQTLRARFTITDLYQDVDYSVIDKVGSPNLMVKVNTTDYEGNIIITWPDGVYPDNTDPYLQNANTNSYVVRVKKHSEYTFQFFKNKPNETYINKITVNKKAN